jgi:hypothetical protein
LLFLECHTQNIIYALTCPCGKFDYIGETVNSLHDRLASMCHFVVYIQHMYVSIYCYIEHREHGNRIMHEFLLGQENITRDSIQSKINGYRNIGNCPSTLYIFYRL